ncbi:hypothetical protein CEXT_253801 [Caerostris extrusa]|uniref:Uncharacterized protein n=1 Tax=Caerostris extrusa TaxID=172846 RepID=A0AAV4XEL6_CAEEX|nr:hypothetical protein CEXT_253801 [Caerostris extrusa]
MYAYSNKSQHLIRTNTCYRRSCNGHLLNQPSERVQHGPLKLPYFKNGHEFPANLHHTPPSAHLVQKNFSASTSLIFLLLLQKNTPWAICAPQGWWEGCPETFLEINDVTKSCMSNVGASEMSFCSIVHASKADFNRLSLGPSHATF